MRKQGNWCLNILGNYVIRILNSSFNKLVYETRFLEGKMKGKFVELVKGTKLP